MDTKQAIQKRDVLAEAITRLVRQFERETGLTVEDIRLGRVDIRTFSGALVDSQPEITVKVGL